MKNVPLDPSYQHTVLFSSKEQQANAFLGFTTGDLTFVNQSYQRHGRGYIKIATNVGNVLNCNYMMFRNYNSETMTYDRWFYAFVTDVEYVNEATTLIRYEIDIMQTWLFDYSLDPVFVEREHSSTDVPGDNLLDEPIDYGDYIFRNFDVLPPFKYESGNMGVAIYFTSQMVDGEKVVYSGLASGFTKENVNAASEILRMDERCDLTMILHFPESAGNETQNLTLSFVICADAVQTKNNPEREFD